MWGSSEKRMTHQEWSDYLLDPKQKLTLWEFIACELAGLHVLLERIHTGLGLDHLNENGTGGSLEQLRNLLDRFVGVVLAGQQPRVSPPAATAPDRERLNGRTDHVRLLPKTDESPREGG
jgi:hypothetical protein